MSDRDGYLLDRAAALREAFDRAFAEPLPADPPRFENLLAIRVGDEPYALRLSEIAGLFADRKVTPLPGTVPGLLGIAGFRGAIVPVYDLHVLLGHPAVEAARWLALAAGASLAFAFAAHEGQFRLDPGAMVAAQSNEPSRGHVSQFARTADLVYPIVDLTSVLDAVRKRAGTTSEANRHSGGC